MAPRRPAIGVVVAIVLTGVGLAAVASPAHAGEDGAPPEEIVIRHASLFPEGIDYDPTRDRFLVGSVTEGTVWVVANDGSLTPLTHDPELKTSFGIQVDAARNRLLVVANSNPAAFAGDFSRGAPSFLGVYDLATGDRLQWVDLAAIDPGRPNFGNDVAVAPDGTAFVTDSVAGEIFEVSPDGKASVFAASRLFPKGTVLNGIEYHPDGFVLAGDFANARLFRVPRADPAAAAAVALTGMIAAPDGITLHPDGSLIVVGSLHVNTVFKLVSSDGWKSATVVARSVNQPATTAAIRNGEVYVNHPKLEELFFGVKTTEASEIVHATFTP